jgi:uncharacterized protein involved in tellurium resistance
MSIAFENEGFVNLLTYLSFRIWEYFSGKEQWDRVFVLDIRWRSEAGGWKRC